MKTKHRPGRDRDISRDVRWSYPTLRVLALAIGCAVAVSVVASPAKKKEKIPRVVSGIVLDESDNPIVGAVVEMTDVQTGKKTATYSQEGGQYLFSGLDENHDYKIQATFKGISSRVRTASSFDTRSTIRLNLQIPPQED